MSIPSILLLISFLFTFLFSIALLEVFLCLFPKSVAFKYKQNIFKSVKEKILDNNLLLLFLIGLGFFIVAYLYSTNTSKEFINGIHVELFGILFDILVLIILATYISSQREKRARIKRYNYEIFTKSIS